MATQRALPNNASKQSQRQKQGLIVLAIVVVAVVIGIIAIALSSNSASTAIDYASMLNSRTEDGAFVLGDPNAPVTIVEFADFGCPHCQTYHETDMARFVSEYVATGKAKLEYRMFPTAGGQLSVFTGQLAECADEQQPGAFWQAYDLLYKYAAGGRYTDEVGRLLAQDLGLNYSTMLACSSGARQVSTDVNFGRTNGVQGTPAVMVRYGSGAAQWISLNGVTYNRSGVPFDVLSTVVESAQ